MHCFSAQKIFPPFRGSYAHTYPGNIVGVGEFFFSNSLSLHNERGFNKRDPGRTVLPERDPFAAFATSSSGPAVSFFSLEEKIPAFRGGLKGVPQG